VAPALLLVGFGFSIPAFPEVSWIKVLLPVFNFGNYPILAILAIFPLPSLQLGFERVYENRSQRFPAESLVFSYQRPLLLVRHFDERETFWCSDQGSNQIDSKGAARNSAFYYLFAQRASPKKARAYRSADA
jgi:hypothetical protein